MSASVKVSNDACTKPYLYGEPQPGFGQVMAGVWMRSPRQAMLMERILVAALAEYAGKAEEGLIAKWHREVVHAREKARREGWAGWEDEYPVEHYPVAEN